MWALPALLFGKISAKMVCSPNKLVCPFNFLLLAGYAVKLDDIRFPISLLQYLSYFRYGFIAYSYLIFRKWQNCNFFNNLRGDFRIFTDGTTIDLHSPHMPGYSGEQVRIASAAISLCLTLNTFMKL